jgi:acetyltransferase-like isoleucine patch superfamily enzyme
MKCIGLTDKIQRKPITIGDCTFIGSHSFIKGGADIGHHCVIASGTIVEGVKIPPYSLVLGNRMEVKESYYKKHLLKGDVSEEVNQ